MTARSGTETSNLTIRPATEADTDAILAMIRLSMGEGTIPFYDRFWTWKHVNNPFGRSPVLVAEADGEIVGLRVFMRWRWLSGSRPVEAVRAVDTATHPAWRGKGIFTRLTLALVEQMQAEGVSFVFNTPNRLSCPGYLKMGWTSLGHISLWIRPLRPLRLTRSLLFPQQMRRSEKANGTSATAEGRTASSVRELLRQPGLDGFLQGICTGESRLRTPRSLRYLSWRYAEIPSFTYHAAWHLDDAEGAIIVYRYKERGGLQELRVCEVLVGPTRRSTRIAQRLLRQVIGETEADYAAAAAAARSAERRALLAAGFLPLPRGGPIFTVRPLGAPGDGVDALQRSAWRTSLGDLELF